jgi:hypothetical protein
VLSGPFYAMRTALVTVLVAFAVTVLTQPPPDGIRLPNPLGFDNIDVFFPLTVSQCEPVFVYYNTPVGLGFGISTIFQEYTDLVVFYIPPGVGYFEWICNIPAGYTIIVLGSYVFVVQPGPSSSCLADITTTYSYASYATSAFRSYTAHPANTTSPIITAPISPSYVSFSCASLALK